MDRRAKINNRVNVIHPYRSEGGWFYDDSDLGVFKEAFVMGSSEVIDHLVGKETNHFQAAISSEPIPMYDALLVKVEHETGLPGWYKLDGTSMVHWLCSCVLDYFPDYPNEIYVKISNKKM